MNIKLIAVDLDGTLLNSEHQIPTSHLKALKTASERGIKVIIATGKTAYSADGVYAQLGFRTAGVFSQGLLIYDHRGELTYEGALPNAVSREIVRYSLQSDTPFVAYKHKEIHALTPSTMDQLLVDFHEPPARYFGTPEKLFAQLPFQKILIHGERERLLAERPKLQTRFGDRCDLVFGNPVMLEFVPKGSSKGDGVSRLLAQLGIHPDEIIAFGDGENDLEMIKMAGVGVAMQNGIPELRHTADFVTTSNDDGGISHALHQFGII